MLSGTGTWIEPSGCRSRYLHLAKFQLFEKVISAVRLRTILKSSFVFLLAFSISLGANASASCASTHLNKNSTQSLVEAHLLDQAKARLQKLGPAIVSQFDFKMMKEHSRAKDYYNLYLDDPEKVRPEDCRTQIYFR